VTATLPRRRGPWPIGAIASVSAIPGTRTAWLYAVHGGDVEGAGLIYRYGQD
jgi:hypothetical protein